MEVSEQGLSRFFSVTSPFLDERQRRLLAGAMAEMLGRGGQARVAEAAAISRNTVIAGTKGLADGSTLQARVRRPGAGPKRKIDLDPDLLVALDELVESPRAEATPCRLCAGRSSRQGRWPPS